MECSTTRVFGKELDNNMKTSKIEIECGVMKVDAKTIETGVDSIVLELTEFINNTKLDWSGSN